MHKPSSPLALRVDKHNVHTCRDRTLDRVASDRDRATHVHRLRVDTFTPQMAQTWSGSHLHIRPYARAAAAAAYLASPKRDQCERRPAQDAVAGTQSSLIPLQTLAGLSRVRTKCPAFAGAHSLLRTDTSACHRRLSRAHLASESYPRYGPIHFSVTSSDCPLRDA